MSLAGCAGSDLNDARKTGAPETSAVVRPLAGASLIAADLAHLGIQPTKESPAATALPTVSVQAAPQPVPTPAQIANPSVARSTHPTDQPLPITLPTALKLAEARGIDVAAASARVQAAAAVLGQARVLWLPTITVGGDYARHDGENQDASGAVLDNSRSSAMIGVGTGIGPAAILNVGEALFAPLAARRQLHAREADRQTASNDTFVAVADAYFDLQQARGEWAGAIEAADKTDALVRRTTKLAPGLVPDLERVRAEAELARRRQAELLAEERSKVASAELGRILRLDPGVQIEPLEQPQLRIELLDVNKPVDEQIPIALASRPELASQQAQVQATLALLKQERLRPLIPSVLLRGFSTPVTGTLGAGVFGGGSNSSIGNGGLRSDFDLQVLWQLDNLGFGNRERLNQREAERRLAMLNLFRVQDRVAAEVAQAHARAQLSARRADVAEKGLRAAQESAEKNLLALGQTRGVGNQVALLVRPQEAVAAVQALGQAYADFYGAVADANRAQFRLYRAMGKPAQMIVPSDETAAECKNAPVSSPTTRTDRSVSAPTVANGKSLPPR